MRSTLQLAVPLTALLVVASLAAGVAAMPTADRESTAGPAVACPVLEPTGSDSADGNVSMTVLTAPTGTYDDLRNASAVRDAVAAGRLVPATAGTEDSDAVVAMNDTAVVEIRLNGSATDLLDKMAVQNEGSPTANFRALVQEQGITLAFRGPSACPPELALNESVERGAIRALPDDERDALYVAFDTDAFLVDPPGTDSEPTATDWKVGRNHLELAVKTTSGLVEANASDGATWDLAPREVEFDGSARELVRVEADTTATVNGSTTLAPGTELAVGLRPLDGGESRTVSATVDANRTFAASVDLPHGIYAVNVSNAHEGDALLAAGDATGALLDFAGHDTRGDRLFGLSATTTDGGFVVVRNASDEVVAVSDWFAAGDRTPQPRVADTLTENQTLTATVYRDVDGDATFDASADEPYRVDGKPVRAMANVTVHPGDSTPTTRTSTSAPTTSTTGSTSTAETSASNPTTRSSTTGESGGSTPGFGVLTALGSLVALASLAALRS